MNEEEHVYYEDGRFYTAYIGEICYRQIDEKWVQFEFTESGEWVEV